MESADQDRFVLWWQQVEPKLLRIGRLLVGSAVAPEVAQDVAIAAYSNFDTFNSHGHFEGWVVTRYKWRVLDFLKIQSKEVSATDASTSVDAMHNEGISPEVIVSLKEGIDALPPRQKEVALLRMLGYKYSEIAKRMNLETAAVRSLYRYAKIKLSRYLPDPSTARKD